MMTGALLKTWKAVKHHVPLIKFRKGGPYRDNTPSTSAATTSDSSAAKPGSISTKAQQMPVIEDWQLPPHYRRTPLDEKEINAINSGGAY